MFHIYRWPSKALCKGEKKHKSDVLTNFWKVGLTKGGDVLIVSGLPRTL